MPKKRKNDKKKKRSVERAPMLDGIGPSTGANAEEGVPEGYENIPQSQALLTASRLALDLLGKDHHIAQDLDLGERLAELALETIFAEHPPEQADARQQALELLQGEVHLSDQEAEKIYTLLQGKIQLAFPPQRQVQGSPEVFISQDYVHELAPLNFGRFALDKGLHAISEDDIELRGHLEFLDEKIEQGEAFDEYAAIIDQVEALLEIGLEEWLRDKKLSGKYFYLAASGVFLIKYLYYEKGDQRLTFKGITEEDIKDFLYNFLLSKMEAKPHDYAAWPGGLKLLYTYLDEIKYCDGDAIVQTIESIEADYVDFLRRRFSPDT